MQWASRNLKDHIILGFDDSFPNSLKDNYIETCSGFDTFFGFYLGGQDYRTHISGIRPGFDLRSDSRGPKGQLVDKLRHDLDGR